MRHQIALAVALLGISSMLCLGRRLEEQQKKKEKNEE